MSYRQSQIHYTCTRTAVTALRHPGKKARCTCVGCWATVHVFVPKSSHEVSRLLQKRLHPRILQTVHSLLHVLLPYLF